MDGDISPTETGMHLIFTVHLQHYVTSRGDNRDSLETKQNINPPIDPCNCSLNAQLKLIAQLRHNLAQPEESGPGKLKSSSRIPGLDLAGERMGEHTSALTASCCKAIGSN